MPMILSNLAEPDGGLVGHVQAGAAGHVVDDGGQVGAFGDGLEVLVQALLRGFVVVGHHQQHTVHSGLLGLLAQLDALGGAVVAGAGDDRAPLADGVLDLAEQPDFFLDSQGRRLAGSA